ncbi:MAG: DeoR/GlpR transcriptional regulator [Ruminococcus sp.]|nr:DeoR/GlpR transcriptional regulator [Ruminococcus sp.]
MEEKANLYIAEKTAIARYAASLLEEGDFVYLDAGTTTEKVIDFIPLKKITFVTNGFLHAKRLAQRGFQVYIPAGAVKAATEAIIGAECVLSLQSYNFTKCLMGVNGISLTAGLSTPDKGEASVKKAAIHQSKQVYFLADHSKFDQISAITFAHLNGVQIITDRLPDQKYRSEATIREVL